MPSKPRLNKSSRLLHRFYEPLVLLAILSPSTGLKEGQRSSTINDSPDQQSNFLDQLAWVCDYKCGGVTVSAIGAEANPSGPVYWLAAPGSPSEKARIHLHSVLEQLRAAHGASQTRIEILEANLIAQCVTFSRKRVENYRRRLSRCAKLCKEQSVGEEQQSGW